MKGAISIHEEPLVYILQSVYDVFELRKSDYPISVLLVSSGNDETGNEKDVKAKTAVDQPVNKIIVICRNICRQTLYDGLISCLHSGPYINKTAQSELAFVPLVQVK
jgi:hypothetical protein